MAPNSVVSAHHLAVDALGGSKALPLTILAAFAGVLSSSVTASTVADPTSGLRRELVTSPGAFRIAGTGDADPSGETMDLTEPSGRVFRIRIDWTEPDKDDPAGDIVLAGLSYRHHDSEPWRPLCAPDHEGRSAGFPIVVPGQTGISIACTSDARGKCARFGYKPWKSAVNGESLLPYYRACLRMVRADYCGDDTSHTRTGVAIRMWDAVGIRNRPDGARAEASWSPGGATCLRSPRAADVSTIERIVAACPAIEYRRADDCDSASRAAQPSSTLIWSEAKVD